MTISQASDITTPTLDLIKHGLNHARTVNADQEMYNQIKGAKTEKEQLKRAANEFESIFITKMLSQMDKTVDRSNSIFGEKSPYVDTFKSIVFQQMAHDMASNPRTSIGLADQIYKQMEKYVN
jgi:Rod binding domain-containing protein